MSEPLTSSPTKKEIIAETFNYPIHTLSEEEINDPYQVIKDIFQFAHLPDLRSMLWNSFKANITGTYPKKLTRRERNEVVNLHEFMVKLIEAIHVIHKSIILKEESE